VIVDEAAENDCYDGGISAEMGGGVERGVGEVQWASVVARRVAARRVVSVFMVSDVVRAIESRYREADREFRD
jgi:hypothetical protein